MLADLLTESVSGLEDIAGGVNEGNFERVMKAAHKIKGSTAYLCCERTNTTAKSLEFTAAAAFKNTSTLTPEENWEKVNELFSSLKTAFDDLKVELESSA